MKSGRIARSSWDNMWIISCKSKNLNKGNCNIGTDIYRKNKKWNKKRKALPHFSVVEEIYLYQAGK